MSSGYGVVHKKVTIVTFMNDKSHLDLDSVIHKKVTIRSRQCCS